MLQSLTLLVLGLGFPLSLGLAGIASWRWLGLGAATWAVAVVVKLLPGHLVWLASERTIRSVRARAAVWGSWSALCELGAAALVYLGAASYPALGDAFGFGVAAGSAEALSILTFSVAANARGGARPEPGATVPEWSGVLERLLASGGHVASRGLVWTGLQSLVLAPFAVLAFVTFTLVDGVATYGQAAGWDWADRGVLRRFYGFVAWITAAELAAFIVGVLATR